MTDNLTNNIIRLLEPQPCLSLHLFDLNGRLLADMRRRLLWRVGVMFERSLARFPGISLQEVYLCGSSASYFWHDESDFDIWLKIHIDSHKFFIKNQKAAHKFLNRYISRERFVHNKLYGIGNRLLDIKISNARLWKMHGVYSLTSDRWLISPTKNLTAGLELTEIYDTVVSRSREYQLIMAQAERDQNGKLTPAAVKKLIQTYNIMVARQYKSVFEYIVFKLLHYNKTGDSLRRFYIEETARALSISSPQPQG